MKTIKNDYCLKMFVGTDDLRPAIKEVAYIGDMLYATNGHIAARIPKDLCELEYNKVASFPAVDNAFKVESDGLLKHNVNDLFHQMMRIECVFKPKMVKFEQCSGDGFKQCSCCGHENDCEDCEGTGKQEGEGIELFSEYKVLLDGKKYNITYIDIIIRTAIITEVKEITITKTALTKATIFHVGDFEILLMPTM